MSKGNHGLTRDQVRQIQEKLGISVDGDFGPATKQAVEKKLSSSGLSVDGDFGPVTIKALGI